MSSPRAPMTHGTSLTLPQAEIEQSSGNGVTSGKVAEDLPAREIPQSQIIVWKTQGGQLLMQMILSKISMPSLRKNTVVGWRRRLFPRHQ